MKVSQKWLALGCLFLPTLLVCTILYLLSLGVYSLGGDPRSIVIGPDDQAYVVDSGNSFPLFPTSGGCVWVVDTRRDQLTGLIQVPYMATDIGVAANGRVYVDRTPSGFGRRSTTFQISMPPCNAAGALASLNGYVLLSGAKDVRVVDSATDQLVKEIAAPYSNYYGMVAISEQEAYLVGSEQVVRLNLNSYEILGYIKLPFFGASEIVADGEAGLAYLVTGERADTRILVLDIQSHQVVDEIAVPSSIDQLVGLCLTSADKLYLLRANYPPLYSHRVNYHITVVSPRLRQVVGKIELPAEHSAVSDGYHRYRIAAAPNGKVYVVHGARTYNSSFQDSPETYVIVIDPQKDEVIGTIPLQRPLWAKLWPFEGIWAVIVLACFSPGLLVFALLVILLGGAAIRSVRAIR